MKDLMMGNLNKPTVIQFAYIPEFKSSQGPDTYVSSRELAFVIE